MIGYLDQTSGHVKDKPESSPQVMGKAVADTNGRGSR